MNERSLPTLTAQFVTIFVWFCVAVWAADLQGGSEESNGDWLSRRVVIAAETATMALPVVARGQEGFAALGTGGEARGQGTGQGSTGIRDGFRKLNLLGCL